MHADLNVPRPPFNVAFAIIDAMDSDRENFLVQAMWRIPSNECQFNFSCFEALGYVIRCRTDTVEDEIRKIVFKTELDRNSSGVATFSAKPFRRYVCEMAAFNGYGVSHYGSRVDIETPQLSNQSQVPVL